MQERRKLKRRTLVYYPEVFDSQTRDPVGHLVDLHEEGLMLFGTREMEKGQNYGLSIEFPGRDFDVQTISFEASCRWCKKGTESRNCAAGFKIETIDAENLQRLREVLTRFAKPE